MLSRCAAVLLCSASLSMSVVVEAGVAHADCTGAGDFGAGSGCPAPGDTSGSGGGESWPPTGVDWPPAQNADDAGRGGEDGDGGSDTPSPIVMPDGEDPPVAHSSIAASTSTSTPSTPIVPVGTAP
jgi:hypothetical protein